MKISDFIFETTRYDYKDFDGYRGEINVSVKGNNTILFITGQKYVDRKETLKELKEFLKLHDKEIEAELQKLYDDKK